MGNWSGTVREFDEEGWDLRGTGDNGARSHSEGQPPAEGNRTAYTKKNQREFAESAVLVIAVHLLGRPPGGWLAAPDPPIGRLGTHPNLQPTIPSDA
jgi:hypothetical protein